MESQIQKCTNTRIWEVKCQVQHLLARHTPRGVNGTRSFWIAQDGTICLHAYMHCT